VNRRSLPGEGDPGGATAARTGPSVTVSQTRVWRGWAGIPLVAGAAVLCFPYTGWWGGDVGVR
jgi:hypothetical protein